MSRKIRLLFVIENAAYGGGEKVFSQLIKGLPKDRFNIFCASLQRGRFYEDIKAHCRFLPLDLTNRFNLRNIGGLKRMMLEHGIEIAHSQGARADFYCAFAAAAAGAKAVSTVAMPVEGFDVNPLKKRVYALLNSRAEKKISRFITVTGRLEAALVSGHGIPAANVMLIPNPVDLSEFDPSNFDAGKVIERYSLRGRLVLGALGRLEWQKGFTHLISAFKIMSGKEPALIERVVCLVAGTGSLEAGLKAQAAAAGLEKNIIFCGETADVKNFLGALDIFVMPSLLEGQPLALLEAMAMARPVVASAIAGISETVTDGEQAVLVPSGNPEALADAIYKLVKDPEAAAQLGASARKKAEGFSLALYIGRHAACYAAVAGRDGGSLLNPEDPV